MCFREKEELDRRSTIAVSMMCLSLQASTYGVMVQTLSSGIGDSPVSSPLHFNTSKGGKYSRLAILGGQHLTGSESQRRDIVPVTTELGLLLLS